MEKKTNILIEYALSVFFFSSVIVFFYNPLTNGDIWFHLNHGKWIVENSGLPDKDPFTLISNLQNTDRIPLFNKGYWLAQVSYYGIFKLDGFRGLNLFYAMLVAGTFFVLWRTLRRQGFSPATALVPMIPCVVLAMKYYNELRPRNYSDLGILLLLGLLEKGVHECRDQTRGITIRTMCLVPMLIILWANSYRGFIVIYFVLAAYLVGESLTHFFRRPMPGFAVFLAWILLSGMASLLNPNIAKPAVEGFRELFQTNTQLSVIELSRPWEYAALVGDDGTYLGCLGLVAAMTAGVMIMARRELEISHLLLYVGFGIAGATAFRYTFYFALISVAIFGIYAARVTSEPARRFRIIPPVLALGFSLFLLSKSKETFAQGREFIDSQFLPVKAVDFLLTRKLPQPILNPYNWGGYISWRAYPQYMVFLDSRMLYPSVLTKVNLAEERGPVQPLLDEYGIQTVIYNHTDSFGNFPRIALDLLPDNQWPLVYVDDIAAIFVRSGGSPFLLPISKQRLSNMMLARVLDKINAQPDASEGYFDLAKVYHALGRKGEAMEAYQEGLRLVRN